MALWRNLFGFEQDETTGEVVFFKLFELFAVGATLHLAWDWGRYILRIGDVVLPLGIARYIDVSFMFGNALPLINAGAITALVLLGFFRVTRYAYLVAFLLLHLQYAARYCLGEIPHSSNLVGMVVLALALAMLAFPDPMHRRRFTLGFTYFFVGLGYTLAGISKLVGTGPGWADGRHLWLWLHEKGVDTLSKTGVLEPNALQELMLASLTAATLVLAVSLLTELLAWLMWWRRFRMPVILAVLGLHVGIYVSMGILFYLSVILLILLGLPWAAWIDRGLRVQAVQRALAPLTHFTARYA